MDLPADRLRDALACIAAWHADPAAHNGCPICRSPGLTIADHSARPYTEWYALKCEACGLDATVHIPMSGPPEF